MAKHNRHLREETNEIIAPIHGNIVVDAGDLMFLDSKSGVSLTGYTADNYALPFSSAVIMNDTTSVAVVFRELENYFLGIAMESSPDGVTENISVATTGVFKMPMPGDSGVTIASLVSAVSPASTTLSASVVAGEASSGYSAECLLGYVKRSASSPVTHVEFEIRTKYNGGVAT